MSSHLSAILVSENLQAVDLVVAMSGAQEREILSRVGPGVIVIVLGDLDPLPIKQRTILDPWDRPVAEFDESYERIHRCVQELVRILWGAH
jgi:protein-tyrosine-phosphatase